MRFLFTYCQENVLRRHAWQNINHKSEPKKSQKKQKKIQFPKPYDQTKQHHKHPEKKTNLGLHLVCTAFTKKTHPLIQEIQLTTRSVGWFGAPRTRQFGTLGQGGLPADNFGQWRFPHGKIWCQCIAMDGKFQLPLTKSDLLAEDDAEKKSSQIQTKHILAKTAMQNPTFCVQKRRSIVSSRPPPAWLGIPACHCSSGLQLYCVLYTVYTFFIGFWSRRLETFAAKKMVDQKIRDGPRKNKHVVLHLTKTSCLQRFFVTIIWWKTSSIQLYSYMWFRSCTHYVRPMVRNIITFTPVSFGKVVLLKSQAHGEEHKRRAGSFHLQHRRPSLFLHPVHRHVTHWYLRKNRGSLYKWISFQILPTGVKILPI